MNPVQALVGVVVAVCLLGLDVGPGASQDKAIQDKAGILAKGAKLEKIFDKGLALTEGVASAPDGTIYFSDITFSFAQDPKQPMEAGHIWMLDPKTLKYKIFRSPSGMSNGIKFDADGNMIVCEGADFGGRKVIRTDMKTGKAYIVAGLYDGRPWFLPFAEVWYKLLDLVS